MLMSYFICLEIYTYFLLVFSVYSKVVDESQRPLKTGSPGCGSLRNDVTSSKPYCKGRDVAEDSQGGVCVECCGSKRCKTCDHIFVGSTFSSNVTGKSYSVRCTALART